MRVNALLGLSSVKLLVQTVQAVSKLKEIEKEFDRSRGRSTILGLLVICARKVRFGVEMDSPWQ